MAQSLFTDPYAQDTLRAIEAANANPLPSPPAPQPNQFLSTVSAPLRGVGAAALEVGAFGFDSIKAFGDVVAGYTANTDPSLLADPQAQAKRWQEGEQARANLTSGASFSSTIGDNLYGFSSGLAPDPATSNVAEQVMFGLSRGLTKYFGMSIASGNPFIGAALTGASEGESASQRLRERGIDINTRSAVGAVAGTGAALAGVVPVAGSTLGRTIAIGLAAGPGLQVAQTAVTKAVLQSANYQQLSDQYDPFDPVALAVSAATAGIFGALGYRGVRAEVQARAAAPQIDPALARPLSDMSARERTALPYNDPRLDDYAAQAAQRVGLPSEFADLMVALKNAGEKSNSGQVSPKGAAGVSQMMPENLRKYGVTDPTDPVQALDGMAKYLADTRQQYGDNLAAIIADYNGGPKQAAAVLQGRQPPAAETRAYLQRVQTYLADRGANEALRGARPTPDQVDAARVVYNRQLLEQASLGRADDLDALATHLTAFQRTIDQMSVGGRVDVGDMIRPDDIRHADALTGMISRLEDARADLLGDIGNMAEPGQVSQLRAQLADLEAAPRPSLDEVIESMQPRRTYEVTRTRAAREQAQIARDAPVELQSRIDAQDAQIARLRASIETNRNAELARAALPQVEQQLTTLRGQRDAIGAPPSRQSAIASATRDVAAEPVRSPSAPAESPAVVPIEASGPTAPAQLTDYTPEFHAANADRPVWVETNPETGETHLSTLSEQMALVDAELARQNEIIPLFRVAAQCFLANGD
ncbi:lytic transglycosylase domain-containing protein [Burkholderia cenocepacia]|uniref:lytic transglycosylase domain-containing protein n=1 Tax=Burkholderia cenocepacia TaxID=95486 RepID=UPI00222EE1AD|nr:transglycosylase SLT domain-containing protein [Burkholderia cenocepacia]MCW3676300.1 transglycosylase SLT domain-containing protein [Burkholderia cenocepacia]